MRRIPHGHTLGRRTVVLGGSAALLGIPLAAPRVHADASPDGNPLENRAMLARLTVGPMAKFRFAEAPKPLEDVEAADAGGRQRVLSAWRGKLVLLNVWASWCAPCKEEMPALLHLQSVFDAEGMAVVALSVDKNPDDARSFLARHRLEALTVLFDPGAAAARRIGVVGYPTTILIDRHGRELGRIESGADWAAPQSVLLVRAMILKSSERGANR